MIFVKKNQKTIKLKWRNVQEKKSLPKSFHGPHDNENALQSAHWPYYWSHFNSVKQADNVVGVQWGLTVYILPLNTWLWRHGPKELP